MKVVAPVLSRALSIYLAPPRMKTRLSDDEPLDQFSREYQTPTQYQEIEVTRPRMLLLRKKTDDNEEGRKIW